MDRGASRMSARIEVEPLEVREVPSAAVRTLPVLPFSDPAVLDNARAIAARGAGFGRRTGVLMKAGDSNTYPESFLPRSYLTPFAEPGYDPKVRGLSQPHPELLDTWAVYHDWFGRISSAADVGWTSADVLSHVAGEVAATNAGISLVMIGTNDLFAAVSIAD